MPIALKSVEISLHQQPETRSVPIFLVLLNPIANFAARKLGSKSIPNINLDPIGSTVPHEMMHYKWYWASIWQYWLVFGRIGPVKLVLLDIRCYRVSIALLHACIY